MNRSVAYPSRAICTHCNDGVWEAPDWFCCPNCGGEWTEAEEEEETDEQDNGFSA